MDRRETSKETGRTPHEQEAAEYGDEARRRITSYSVWQKGQSASPRECASAPNKGRRLAFERLYREVLRNVSEEVEERDTICRSLRRLWALCRSCPREVDNLSDLFDALLASGGPPDFNCLAAILEQRLRPIIRRHFWEDERTVLEKALKTLIVLRTLELPYRPGTPILSATASDLLASLHRLCDGDGLMVWPGDGGEPVYVVERDVERFVTWLLARLTAFPGRRERDRALFDALWATLSAEKAAEEVPFEIQPTPFAEWEAVWIRHRTLGKRVLLFESPWEEERGRRVHRVVRRLPEDVTPDHVWVWLPAPPHPDEEQQITCHAALARALRGISEQGCPSILDAMGGPYLRASVWALRAIVGCYRRGTVVTERGTWHPNGHQGPLVSMIEHLVAWETE